MHSKMVTEYLNTISSNYSIGVGPYDTVTSWDYYYFPGKPRMIQDWVYTFNCDRTELQYPTPMDGVDNWTCSLWSKCR